jgi:RNA polymerase sigma factor (sigma-70 family)
MPDASTTELQGLIDHLASGDPSARQELIDRACARLRRLAQRIFHDFARLKRLEDTDDVLNEAVVRLLRRLDRGTPPASVAEFFRLAAREMRCELLDMVRHHFGPEGPAAREANNLNADSSRGPVLLETPTTTDEPGRLAIWTEFHRHVEDLPDEERAVFDLVWYQGLTQAEAAILLGVAPITIKRRWASARLLLGTALFDLVGEANVGASL